MAKYFRKKILLAKVEATYGTDPTPTGAANAILTKDLTIQLMQGQTVQRNTDREVLGNELTYHVAPYTTLSFGVELAGSGTGRCQERCRIFSFDVVWVSAFADGWIYPG